MKRPLAIAGTLLALAALWLCWPRPTAPPLPSSPTPPPPPQVITEGDLTVLLGTPFDRDFSKAGGTPENDLALLQETLSSARLLVKNHAEIPLADNRDFTTFLSGKNPHRVAWIRPGHPQVNAAGELTDRWGTPIFFHPESASHTSLRSAGPDRTLWTDDDVSLGEVTTESP